VGGADFSVSSLLPYAANVEYTLRLRFMGDNTTLWTVQGGAYANETVIYRTTEGALGADWYWQAQRQTNHVNVTYVDDYKEFALLSAANPTLTYNHDAGAPCQFVNFDPRLLALPGGLVSPNLRYRWSFDDGAPAWSGWLTLAALNGLAKQIGWRRFVRLGVQFGSDSVTQAYGTKPNHASAVDYVRVTPLVPTWGGGEVSGIA
jgi:hypothetical protein